MRTSMMSHPNSLFGSSVKAIRAALLSAGLLVAATGQAAAVLLCRANPNLNPSPARRSSRKSTNRPLMRRQRSVRSSSPRPRQRFPRRTGTQSARRQEERRCDQGVGRRHGQARAHCVAGPGTGARAGVDHRSELRPLCEPGRHQSRDWRSQARTCRRQIQLRAGRGVGQRDPDTHHKHPVGYVSGGDQGYHAADRRRQDRRGESAASGGARNPRHYHRGDSIAHDTGREPAQ